MWTSGRPACAGRGLCGGRQGWCNSGHSDQAALPSAPHDAPSALLHRTAARRPVPTSRPGTTPAPRPTPPFASPHPKSTARTGRCESRAISRPPSRADPPPRHGRHPRRPARWPAAQPASNTRGRGGRRTEPTARSDHARGWGAGRRPRLRPPSRQAGDGRPATANRRRRLSGTTPDRPPETACKSVLITKIIRTAPEKVAPGPTFCRLYSGRRETATRAWNRRFGRLRR